MNTTTISSRSKVTAQRKLAIDSIQSIQPPQINLNDIKAAQSIYLAIIQKDEKRGINLIDKMQNADLDYQGKPLLIHAILNNQEKIANCLLEKGASSNRTSPRELPPASLALLKNSRTVIKKLFEKGFDVNKSGGMGLTPLMIAVMSNQKEKVQLMIKNNVAVNYQDSFGRTALMYASMRRKDEMIDILLQNGGNPSLKDCNQHTAHEYYKLWDKGLQMDHSPELEDDNINTKSSSLKLVPSPEEKMLEAVKRGDFKKLTEITENQPVNLNYQKSSSFKKLDKATPLMFAALFGRDEIIKYLVTKGADINKGNEAGFNPLKIAGINRLESTIKLLLQLGANSRPLEEMAYIKVGENPPSYPISPIEAIKRAVIIVESSESKDKVDEFFRKLEKVQNPVVKNILTLGSLYTLGNSSKDASLKFVFNLEKGISGANLNPINKSVNGKFDPIKNMIYVSNLQNPEEALRIFIHELTHKLRITLPEKNFEELFYSTMESKNKFLALENPSANLTLYKYTVLQRTELGVSYQNVEKILEENIADNSKILMDESLQTHPRSKLEMNDFNSVMEALGNFWEKKMKPQILQEIYNHPERKNIILPCEIKLALRNMEKHPLKTTSQNKEQKTNFDLLNKTQNKGSMVYPFNGQ